MATSGQFFGSPSALALGAAGNGLSDNVAITGILGVVPDASIIAAVIPSPFQGLSPTTFPAGSESELNLVDGGYAFVLLIPFSKSDLLTLGYTR